MVTTRDAEPPIRQRLGARLGSAGRWLVVIVVVGWLLRVVPLVVHGAFGVPVDYDEGVYFSAAALLARGHAIYNSFTFVHPPGLLYLLAPLTWLGRPSFAFGASRVAMTIVGAANIVLVARIALRFVGARAALVGAFVYAVYPEVVRVERGVYLEPLLNFFCLSAALVWFRARDDEESRRWPVWLTGVLLGAAIGIKLLGVLALIACVATVRRGRLWRDGWRLVTGAVASLGVILLPVVVRSPTRFFDDVVVFQLRHAGDGARSVGERLGYILFDPSTFGTLVHRRALMGTAFVIVGAVVFVGFDGWRSRMLRFAFVWYLAIVLGFLASAAYFQQYNAHLAPAVALIAAGAAGAIFDRVGGARRVRDRVLAAGAGAVLAVALAAGVGTVLVNGSRHSNDVSTIATAERRNPAPCGFAFEPAWLIAADELPDVDRAGLMAVDPYGAQLEAVVSSGRSYVDASSAFHDPASEVLARRVLAQCATVTLGPRGQIQLGDLLGRFVQQYQRVATTSAAGPDLWIRRSTDP